MSLNKSQLSLLSEVLTATNSAGNGWVVANAPATKALIDAGYIEVNHEMLQGNEVAARVTEAGRQYAATGQESGNSADAGQASDGFGGGASAGSSAPASKPERKSFAIETVPLVERTRQPTTEQYPFAALEVGQSFFVADSDVKSRNAFKTLNSTVTTANNRYSVETGETRPHRRDASKTVAVRKQERKFELRHFTNKDEAGNDVKGARVYRVEVPAAE